jgi:long-chain acyl-CoA synthetase
LLYHAETRPRAVAHRVKELGRWRDISWKEHAARVASVGRALSHLGVGAGERVLLMSENRVEWVITDLAVQGLGAATVGVFPSTPAPEAGDLLRRSRARFAVVEDEEQLDKLLAGREGTPLERIFVIDTRGIRRLDSPADSFELLEALGTLEAVGMRAGDPAEWHNAVAALEPGRAATVVFTPGTTGAPKGVTLTNANLATAAEIGVTAYGLRAGDRIVSCLPLGEMAERVLVVAQATRAACTVHFGEGGDALENDVREVEPTVLLGAPRLWERFRDRIEGRLHSAGRVKQAAFHLGVSQHSGVVGRLVGRALVTTPLRRHVGLSRVRTALVAGAPAPVELLGWWAALGIRLREVYGLTESTGVGTVVAADAARHGTVGRVVPGVEVAIAETAAGAGAPNEVLLRGPTVFAGYLDDPAATEATLDDDGWLHTGDVGTLDDDGNLTIVDRIKGVIVTSGGHAVAPGPIERRLTASPYVRVAIVVGDDRPHLGALLALDEAAVSVWAADHGVPFTTARSLLTRPEIRQLVDDWVSAVNDELADEDRVRRFALVPGELGVDNGLMTATFKVRRAAIATRYADLVEEMFA